MKRCKVCGAPGTYVRTNSWGDVYSYDCLPYCTIRKIYAGCDDYLDRWHWAEGKFAPEDYLTDVDRVNDFRELWAEQLQSMDERIEASDFKCGCDPLGASLVDGVAWAYLPQPIGWHNPNEPHQGRVTHPIDWPNQ